MPGERNEEIILIKNEEDMFKRRYKTKTYGYKNSNWKFQKWEIFYRKNILIAYIINTGLKMVEEKIRKLEKQNWEIYPE